MLFKYFQHARGTIAFWLTHCVFPKDLQQYVESITASSWDIADSKFSLGFSGTKDTRWVFPHYLNMITSDNL